MSVISGEENIHPAQASLDDVMRKIWNDYAGFSPELRENLLPPAYPQRLERLEPLERIDPRGERRTAVERLERLELATA